MNVITITGEEIDKKRARKIKSLSGEFKYYKIGNINVKNSGDCYQINNIFYTIEKGRIEWDCQLNQYALKTTLVQGIIDEEYNKGYFNKNAPDIVSVFLNKEPISEYCISRSIAENTGLIEGNKNLFYNPLYYSYDDILPRQEVDRNYKNSLSYNFKNVMIEATRSYNSYNIDKNKLIKYNYNDIGFLFNNYTFGVELETTRGIIPESLYKSLGVRPVRDGSITGLEYVTIPLTGEKGFCAFIDIVELLNKYTSSDYTCSMHIHIGGVPRSEEFIVAMFKTMFFIQDDIYELFPRYKKNNGGIKRMCYTAPLDKYLMTSLNYSNQNHPVKIREDYVKIIHELSGRHSSFRKYVPLEDINNHPSDPSESSKWYMKERYKILNLIPLIFTNKQTIEYRIFTVPDTVEKAISFLVMSLVITRFVHVNMQAINNDCNSIKDYNFNNILSSMIRSNDPIMRFLQQRQMVVNNILNEKGGFFEEKDVKLKLHAKPNYKELDRELFEAMEQMRSRARQEQTS